MNAKYFKGLIPAALLALAMTACDDDKVYTTWYEEAIVPSEITFKVSELLPLAVGMDSTLVYTVGPEEASHLPIIFKSSDEKVATVSQDGTIHAVSVGEAVISAVPERLGFGATGTVTVQVIPEVIKVSEVKVENTTPAGEDGKIYVTDVIQLKQTLYPENHTYDYVTWVSSDPTKATVDETGKVNCLAAGDVVIRCITHDKSNVGGDFNLHIDPYIAVEKVIVNSHLTGLTLPGYEIPVDVTYQPAGATIGSVDWETNDDKVCTVERGKVTATGFGSTTIVATCRATGETATIEVSVTPGLCYWGPENKWSGWVTSSNDAPEVRGDEFWRISFPATTGKWRRDIKIDCSANNLFSWWHSDYPVYAIKTNVAKGGNNTFDIRDANSKDNAGTDLSDGNRLIVWDAAVGKWEGYHGFNLFQVKIADIPNANVDPNAAYYDVFWIRSFKSKEDAIKFAEDEIKASK
ncbi:MAG: Ig-like domain-containing protein [Muribaculaceae bacterium]|nr:Ig-like domain-containing protein [Muribaculaceae bacterium]